MSDVEVVKLAIWVARDLSVRHDGRVPDAVRDAPLALQRLVEENALLRRVADVLSDDFVRGKSRGALTEETDPQGVTVEFAKLKERPDGWLEYEGES